MSWVAPPQGGPDNQITGYELVYRRADDTEEVSFGQNGDTAGGTFHKYFIFISHIHGIYGIYHIYGT